jgi:hypothetical protein
MDDVGARTTSVAVSVVVNMPPTVQLASPVSGATFSAPATMSLAAMAADSDGRITAVRFVANGAMVASVTASPFSFNWTNVAAGTYTITAIATDNAGGETTSVPATVTVKAPNAMPTVTVTSP